MFSTNLKNDFSKLIPDNMAKTSTFLGIGLLSSNEYFSNSETEDFNSDGHLDIALASNSSGAGSIRLFIGNGDGTFQKPQRLAEQLAPLALVASDMNSDDKVDLVFASGQGDNMYILNSNADGSFKNPIMHIRSC